MTYHFSRVLDLPFDKAVEAVTAALSQQGFGVLTEIDVQATLKKKLNVDFRSNFQISSPLSGSKP